MNKIERKKQKALEDIPREIRRLSNTVALVGKILANKERIRLEHKRKKFKKMVEERRDVT